jgi:hypothetical protein
MGGTVTERRLIIGAFQQGNLSPLVSDCPDRHEPRENGRY